MRGAETHLDDSDATPNSDVAYDPGVLRGPTCLGFDAKAYRADSVDGSPQTQKSPNPEPVSSRHRNHKGGKVVASEVWHPWLPASMKPWMGWQHLEHGVSMLLLDAVGAGAITGCQEPQICQIWGDARESKTAKGAGQKIGRPRIVFIG